MRDILQAIADGSLSVTDAEQRLKLYAVHEIQGLANLDLGRNARMGRPEIVRGAGKTMAEALALAFPILDQEGTVVLSGATEEHEAAVRTQRPHAHIRFEPAAGLLVARRADTKPPGRIGSAAIVTAGTSDVPVALQAQVIAETLGVETTLYADAGIAGLHRVFPVLERIVESDPDCVIVVAGQEGGLAPVLGGLIDLPIIAVPTSTGTGFGGQGIAALSTMLQACTLGLAVVNIDNGIAAGVMAAAISRRARRA